MLSSELKPNTDVLISQSSFELDSLLTRYLQIKFSNRESLKPILECLLKICIALEDTPMNTNQKLEAEKILLNFKSRIQNSMPSNMVAIVDATLYNITKK